MPCFLNPTARISVAEMNNRVVVFADEIGIPLILESLPKSYEARVVYDPKRNSMADYLSGLDAQICRMAHPEKEDRRDFLERLCNWGPALGIMASYSRILWPELMDIFPLGVVNLHAGKLPEYRGANVLQWVLIQGERETAVTLHYVDRKIDAGPVIHIRKVAIDDDDTAKTLRAKMMEVCRHLLKQWVPRLLIKRCPAAEQDESRAKMWRRRLPEDGLIDWSWADEKIRNLTRALVKPWPGVFYMDRSGKKFAIDRALSTGEIQRLRREALS